MMKKNIANIVSVSRVLLLGPVILCALSSNSILHWIGWFILIGSFGLDAIDGYFARRYGSVSFIGSFLDILADRLTEVILFAALVYTTGTLLVPKAVLIVFFARILLVDVCRIRAFMLGELTPKGPRLSGAWRYLNLSTLSRGGYASYKALYFSVLIFFPSVVTGTVLWGFDLSMLLNSILVALSIIRGLPILHMTISEKFFVEKQARARYSLPSSFVVPNLVLILLDGAAMIAVVLR